MAAKEDFASARDRALPAGHRLDMFEILEVISCGGFGIVYRARESTNPEQVALKEYFPRHIALRDDDGEVRPSTDSAREAFGAGLDGFIREAGILATLRHPSLLRVERFWLQSGTAYLSMPYYPGATLKQIAESLPESVTPAWLERMLGMLLGALELLHERGYYHRDIAPDNIILGVDGQPVLLDLGAARQSLCCAVNEPLFVKPGYSPLEQYVEEGCGAYGAWSDLYALGAVLYRLIGRRTPPASVVRSIEDTLVPLGAMGLIGYSSRTLAAIDRTLCLRGSDRPQSVAEFAAELGMRRRGDCYAPASPYYPNAQPITALRVALAEASAAAERKPDPDTLPWYLRRAGRLLTILIASLLSGITLLYWIHTKHDRQPGPEAVGAPIEWLKEKSPGQTHEETPPPGLLVE